MKRPGRTAKQKQHDREQRAMYRLKRAAVRYSIVGDSDAGVARRKDR